MEFFTNSEALCQWLLEYGGIALFTLLTLEIIALPIPGEPLMILTGVLMHKGQLPVGSTALAAFAGSAAGIHISYFLGQSVGHRVLVQYGSYVGITAAKLAKTNSWFQRFGKWTLFIGYYIPGVRHLTGFLSGASCLDYRSFCLFAVSGAFLWVAIFLSLGYFFGDYWMTMFDSILNFRQTAI